MSFVVQYYLSFVNISRCAPPPAVPVGAASGGVHVLRERGAAAALHQRGAAVPHVLGRRRHRHTHLHLQVIILHCDIQHYVDSLPKLRCCCIISALRCRRVKIPLGCCCVKTRYVVAVSKQCIKSV